MARIPSIIGAKGSNAKPSPGSAKGPAVSFQQTSDRQVNDLQNSASQGAARAAKLPFGDGNLHSQIFFPENTPVVINHGLGAAFSGFLVLNLNTNACVFRIDQSPASLNSKTITLQGSAECTADIWVYR